MAPTRRQFVQDSSTLAAAGMMLSFNPLAYASNQRPECGFHGHLATHSMSI
nr:twin-arginine translocation signal domain-containing protein [Pseudomonas sp.]